MTATPVTDATPALFEHVSGLTKDSWEFELVELIRTLAKRYGLVIIEIPDSRKLTPHIPDLTIIGSKGIAFREIKKADGRVTKGQRAMLQWLCDQGYNAGVWRPIDYTSGKIERELALLAGKTTTMGLSIGWQEAA